MGLSMGTCMPELILIVGRCLDGKNGPLFPVSVKEAPGIDLTLYPLAAGNYSQVSTYK